MTVLAMLTGCRQTLIWITLIYKPTPQHILYLQSPGACWSKKKSSLTLLIYKTHIILPGDAFLWSWIMFSVHLFSFDFMFSWMYKTCRQPAWMVIDPIFSGGWKWASAPGASVRLRPWWRCQQIGRCLFPGDVEAHSLGLRWAWHKVFVLIGCW